MAEEALSNALSRLNIVRDDRKIVLKEEKEMAVNHLLNGRDVMAILPTGFGKSMIFTVFALAKQELSSTKTSVLVISPLKSIIDDQISEMLSLNFTAMELSSETIDLVRDNPPQFSLSALSDLQRSDARKQFRRVVEVRYYFPPACSRQCCRSRGRSVVAYC